MSQPSTPRSQSNSLANQWGGYGNVGSSQRGAGQGSRSRTPRGTSVTRSATESDSDEDEEKEEEQPEIDEAQVAAERRAALKGIFQRDLRDVMYGFGDEPAADTVELMEDILIEYLNDVIAEAAKGAGKSLQTDDLRRALSGPGDERKLARLEELIVAQTTIKKARQVGMDVTKPAQLAEYQNA